MSKKFLKSVVIVTTFLCGGVLSSGGFAEQVACWTDLNTEYSELCTEYADACLTQNCPYQILWTTDPKRCKKISSMSTAITSADVTKYQIDIEHLLSDGRCEWPPNYEKYEVIKERTLKK